MLDICKYEGWTEGRKEKTNATEKRRWEAVLKLPSFGAVSASQMGINGEGWGTIKRIQKKKTELKIASGDFKHRVLTQGKRRDKKKKSKIYVSEHLAV